MQKRNVVRSARCGSSAAASTVMVSTTSKQARWSCALEFSWTLDCEKVLAGGVSRCGRVEESTAAAGARRAPGAAIERDRKGRFSAWRKRATGLRLLRGEELESVSRELGDHGGAGLPMA